ncbi:MAG: hypothetical protein HQM02_11660, partial [Magnetococcales bacterium]|nr:hypothetical protein [Magnetococcales bacterium]
MSFKKHFILLGLVMVLVALTVGGVTLWTLYASHVEESRNRLREVVQSQARIMEAVAGYDRQHTHGDTRLAVEATISQIRQAHERFKGFGATGEFVLARREGERIVFVLSHR